MLWLFLNTQLKIYKTTTRAKTMSCVEHMGCVLDSSSSSSIYNIYNLGILLHTRVIASPMWLTNTQMLLFYIIYVPTECVDERSAHASSQYYLFLLCIVYCTPENFVKSRWRNYENVLLRRAAFATKFLETSDCTAHRFVCIFMYIINFTYLFANFYLVTTH